MWDQLAPEYDQLRASDPVYWSCIVQAVEALRPAGTVLDAGCGTGATTRFLLNCEHVDALDFSATPLDVLHTNLGEHANLELVQGDVRELPFPDESFDCVLCANTINCLTREMQSQAAAELMRVLKPGGRYVVSAHHYSRDKRRRHWVKEGRPGAAGHRLRLSLHARRARAAVPGCRLPCGRLLRTARAHAEPDCPLDGRAARAHGSRARAHCVRAESPRAGRTDARPAPQRTL